MFLDFEISPFNMRKNVKMSIADHFEMWDWFFEMWDCFFEMWDRFFEKWDRFFEMWDWFYINDLERCRDL